MIWWNYFDVCVRLHFCEVYCVLLYILYCFCSFFYLCCPSVCLYVSYWCLWAMLPDLNKMMMMMIRNADQCGQTRPVDGRRTAKWKRTCPVSTFARAVGRGLNADRTECRPPKNKVCGRNADPSHTANHHLAAWNGCQFSQSTFRQFGIPTVKHTR